MQNVVKDTYRGTAKYNLVRDELVRAAQYHGVTTYKDIAAILEVPSAGGYMAGQTGRVCGEISEDEVKAGRPMLSAVAVSQEGEPGSGFFDCARAIGRLGPSDDEQQFWENEQDAVYKTWRRQFPK